MAAETRWVGTWAASPVLVEGAAFENQTFRMIARVSLGGSWVRARFSNAYGLKPLAIGGASIGRRMKGALVAPGSYRKLSFGGAPTITIPAGAFVVSDEVPMDVPDLADLAVSAYVPGAYPENFLITGHGLSHQTNYISPPGDHSGQVDMDVKETTEAWYLLTGIDVVAPASAGGIVAFGDSLTDGNLSSLDSNSRWPDQLARRLAARKGGRPMGVMNHGIGGNRILHDTRGDSGVRRFDRDALAQPGVTHIIVFLGTNDLRNRNAKPEEEVTAAQMIAGLQQLATRAKIAGIKSFGCTLLPSENETFLPGAWTPARDRHRRTVNAWLRESNPFDHLLDFDKLLRDPEHDARMLPIYDCGDHLHPSDFGYTTLGDSIDLALFD